MLPGSSQGTFLVTWCFGLENTCAFKAMGLRAGFFGDLGRRWLLRNQVAVLGEEAVTAVATLVCGCAWSSPGPRTPTPHLGATGAAQHPPHASSKVTPGGTDVKEHALGLGLHLPRWPGLGHPLHGAEGAVRGVPRDVV